jgi:hypothetical protein
MCGPNSSTRDSCFSFTVDASGPLASMVFPEDGSFTSCSLQVIKIRITDPQGVRFDSSVVSTNSRTYRFPDHLIRRGDTLILTTTTPLHAETVTLLWYWQWTLFNPKGI